jgi:putative membrane protein
MSQMSRLDELAVERNRLATERNQLAVQRNELANERTFLAYARTSIMGFVTGVTLFKLYPENMAMLVLGSVSIAASVVIAMAGAFKSIRRYKSLLTFRLRPRAPGP